MSMIEVINCKKHFKPKQNYQTMTVLKILKRFKSKTSFRQQVQDSSKIIFKGNK